MEGFFVSEIATLEQLTEDFEILEDWEDRYMHLIAVGKALPALEDKDYNPANKVEGCASQVWLVSTIGEGDDPILTFRGDSDAFIVKGLVAIALSIYSGKTASEIVETDAAPIYKQLGLSEHLSAQRANGLKSMVARIQSDARRALGTG